MSIPVQNTPTQPEPQPVAKHKGLAAATAAFEGPELLPTTLDLLMGPPCDPHGQPGCADCARVALRDSLGMCAEHLRRNCHVCGKVAKAAKKQADRRAWLGVFPDDRDTLELAADTGRIGNTVPKSGGHIRLGKPVTNVTARFRPKPDKPRRQKCLKPQWGKGTDTHGWGFKMWHRCNKCENCAAFALNLKAWRWDVGRGPFQVSIMVNGAANADEARKWTGQLAKAVNLPNRASLVTDAGEIWIVAADRWTPTPFSESENLRLLIMGTANGLPCNASSKARTSRALT